MKKLLVFLMLIGCFLIIDGRLVDMEKVKSYEFRGWGNCLMIVMKDGSTHLVCGGTVEEICSTNG